MSVFGILGGIGKGLTAGREESRRRKNDEQVRRLRDFQIAQAEDDAKLRDETRNLMATADADAAAMQAASRARTVGINNSVAQANADTAIAADTGNAIKAGISDTVSRLTAAAPATPTPGQMAAPAAPTGIAASANRVGDLSNTNPRTSPTPNAQPISKDASQAVAWKDKSQQLAAIYRKHGKVKEADDILKSGESAAMNVYSHQFDSAMRDLALGATQSAAGKLAALHNMSSDDGSFVDIQPNKDGTFTATQFDAEGKNAGSKVIGSKELDDYAEKFLSPAQVALRKQQLIADTQLKKAQIDADSKDRKTGANIIINTDRNASNERQTDRKATATERSASTRAGATVKASENRAGATVKASENAAGSRVESAGVRAKSVVERTEKEEAGKNKRAADKKPAFGSKSEAAPSRGKIVKDADGNYVYQR